MDKSSKSVNEDSERIVGDTSNRSMDKREEDRSDQTIKEETCVDRKNDIPEIQGSPELRRKVSRTVAVRDDARRLKTATLDRMGKIFKLKSTEATSSTDDQRETGSPTIVKDPYTDEQSTKDKTNSLGRMFKLVDKNGEPRKLFQQSRTGSLSRILRRTTIEAKEEKATGAGNHSGVFSRIFNQWKSRSKSGNSTAEPNLRVSTIQENKSLSAKPLATSTINLSSSNPEPSQPSALTAATVFAEENSANIEYPA